MIHAPRKAILAGGMPSRLLCGSKAKLVFVLIKLRILCLALYAYRKPWVAWTVLRGIIAKKQAIVGRIENMRLASGQGRYFWSLAATGWPSKAFDRLILNEMNKIRPFQPGGDYLQTMVMSITSRCPMHCEHCYEWDNISAEEALSVDDLIRALWKFQEYGITNIQFSGGEPLCRYQDLLRLLGSARPGTDFWILTSGYGLSAEKARQLREAGLAGVAISLDHFDEEAHDAFRHYPRAFRLALEAARNARQAGLVVAFSLCATRDFLSPENLRRYLMFAQESGASMVRLLEPRRVGHYKGVDVELDERCVQMLTACYLENIHAPGQLGMPIIEYSGYYQRQCGCFAAGDRSLYMDSTGEVHACPFCQGSAGNAVSQPLPPIIDRLREIGCHKFSAKMPEEEIVRKA